jgi:hypothetical protein
VKREKHPAAVALGKRRHELATDEERAKNAAQLRAACARRTLAEHKANARKAAMTKRLQGPKWIRKQNSAPPPADGNAFPPPPAAGSTGEPPAGGLAQLGRALDECPDDLLVLLAEALTRRPA